MNPMDPHNLPDSLFREYRAGLRYKNALGGRGMAEQNRINGRFYIGDQWHGARCGESRPLVRHNIIKRIADYKMAVVGAAPVAVEYTAEGVPATAATLRAVERLRDAGAGGKPTAAASPEEEAALVASALSDYFRVTAERVNFTDLKDRVLRDAYITGTGVLYTYWDEGIPTGQYADFSRTAPIGGDIACEVLDIDSVFFGDPAEEDVQAQPYILIAQRRGVADLRRQARRRGCPDWRNIVPDREGPLPEDEDAPGGRKATLLTRFWKEWDETGERYTIMAAQVCRGVVVRPPWDLGVRLYPLAVFRWERGRGGAYGESEITYLIPNQIAINRMITASVWAVMMMGMPIMVVNGDVVTQPITNDPGQVVQVFGTGEDADKAIRYVSPPAFSPQFDQNIASLIENTLAQAGVNNAVLGDVRPDNTSAIVAVREAAILPLQVVQNRFYGFCEDAARVWAEFWITQYGRRSLKIQDERGTWYLPFDGNRWRDLLLHVRVDVGASTLFSESRAVQTLDTLLDREVITPAQYLSRLPRGAVPNLAGLIRELNKESDSHEAEDSGSRPAGESAKGRNDAGGDA